MEGQRAVLREGTSKTYREQKSVFTDIFHGPTPVFNIVVDLGASLLIERKREFVKLFSSPLDHVAYHKAGEDFPGWSRPCLLSDTSITKPFRFATT